MGKSWRPLAALSAGALGAAVLAGCGVEGSSKSSGSTAANDAVAAAAPAHTGRFFAASSAWNQRADSDPIASDSASMLRLAAQRIGVIEQPGNASPLIEHTTVQAGLTVNTARWSPPIVDGGVPTRIVCRQQRCGDSVESLRVPTNVSPDPRYDGWFTVIEGNKAYDLWRARRESTGTISYQFLRQWSLDGPGAGAPGQDSARGSGLPLFAGVIRASELRAGLIDHALAIAVPAPAQHRYVRPASATNGNGDLSSLPEGARIRLKPGVRLLSDRVDGRVLTRPEQRSRDAILVALRQYGAIVVDRASVPTLYAERGIAASDVSTDELSHLGLRDFDVVKLGTTLTDPPAADGTKR